MDRGVGDFHDLVEWCERTPLLRSKPGRNPTSAAKHSVWSLSRRLELPPPTYAHPYHPFGPWVDYDVAHFTEFAMSVEISHFRPPKSVGGPQKGNMPYITSI